MNLAFYVSAGVSLAGVLFAIATLSIASAPNMRGLRVFSLASLAGALYAATNATLSSGSFDVSRIGIRFGLPCIGLHCATWYIYTARREGRRLRVYEKLVVVGSGIWALLALVPNLLYRTDEDWVHGVPALDIWYIDARSTTLGDIAFVYFGITVGLLLYRAIRRFPTSTRIERAELLGLSALYLCAINDSFATAGVLGMPYLLDLGFLTLVVAVGSTLARRFVDDAKLLNAAQEELIQRERLAALGEMSAVVAHEVRNPVSIIFNAVASMRKSPGKRDEMIGIVEEEAGRLSQMVSDLLDFARPATVRMVEEPLAPIVASALEALRQASQDPAGLPDVEVAFESDVPELLCDVRLLRQAIVNLVSNAIQSPDRKGPVKISIGFSSPERVHLRVIDDGAGVPADIADRIFRPFFTTRPTGVGLGLTVVERIVRAHGGELRHHPTPGGGATFEVELPLRRAA